MFKKMLYILLALMIPIFVFAQSSGKIMGVITDKETGEPLPGVNIVIQGTNLGGTSDIDGYYVILNVPVSEYSIEASYVGYTTTIISNIRVSAGVTTEQDFQLQPTTLELGEAVIVTGERPLVEKYVTHSVARLNADELSSIPVRGTNSILAIQPSVVVQDGNVYIRGGRNEEVGYYLDGASTVNPTSNTNSIYVIQDAVEEIQVLSGGFGAEFGNANSGIVRSELKTGGSDYNFALDAQTDRFAGEGDEVLGTYSYQDHIVNLSASGPITNDIRFFISGENTFTGDTKKRFSEGYSFENLVDRNELNPTANPNSPLYNPDTVSVSYPDGHTPGNELTRYAVNSTLLFDFSPFQFRLSGIYNYAKQYFTDEPMTEVLNDRSQYSKTNVLLLSGKFTHVLSPTTFYNLKLSYYNRHFEDFDDWFENDWQAWVDSARIADYTNGDVTYRSAYRWPYNYELEGIPFDRQGRLKDETYDLESHIYYGGSLDFISQLNRTHELKFGAEARFYTIRDFDIDPIAMETVPSGGQPEDADPFKWQDYVQNNYGYDIYGNEIDKGFDGPKQPIFAGLYLQDKLEYNDIIINAGLRVDYFDPDDRELINESNPEVDLDNARVLESAWKDIDPYFEVSPRLGFSFPVSEKTVFYTHYGKFVQMPELNDSYFGTAIFGRQITSGGNYYGINTVGFGLEPIQTTSYELGFRQQLGDNAAFDITGFYKNVKNQPTSTRVIPDQGARISGPYNRLTAGDFATTKGLEFKVTLRRTHNLQAQLNYTLTQSEGTGSGELAYISAVDRNAQTPTVISPLDFSQTHRGAVNLDYRFGADEGGPIFNRFGANVLATFNSGHPYTYVYFPPGGQVNPYNLGVDYMDDTRSREAREPVNSSTTPWNFNVDLRLDRSFDITEDIEGIVFLRITNLLNTKNVINVFQATGNASDDGILGNPDYSESWKNRYAGWEDLYRAINLKNGAAYLDELGLELYSHPRQIWFGLKLVY